VEPLSLLVAHDFTAVADAATLHALHLARQLKAEVHLLHIIKNDSEAAAANQKFDEIKNKLALKPWDPKLHTHVKKGNIFNDIGNTAEQLKCMLIIMGTHGAKGMQKVFGSFAIKVINSTNIPFVIVQDKIPSESIKKIVFPVDTNKESLQIVYMAATIASQFNSEIIMVAPKEEDAALKTKLKVHIEVVKKQIEKRNVKHEIKLLEKTKAYHETVLDFARQQQADMIAISYFSDRLLPQFDPFAQSIITNKDKLPVLILTASETGIGFF
jgi:nucleotide-binding universal stress UspA family protein